MTDEDDTSFFHHGYYLVMVRDDLCFGYQGNYAWFRGTSPEDVCKQIDEALAEA